MAGSLAWERVGNHFFRHIEGPMMRWDLNIAHVNMRAAPCCGVIAVWDKEDAIIRKDANAPLLRPLLRLFGSEGKELGQIKLDFGVVVDVHILSDETIIVVTRNGLARHFTEFGKNFVQLHIPGNVEDIRFADSFYVAHLRPSEDSSELALAWVTRCSSPAPRCRVSKVSLPRELKLINWDVLPERPDIGLAAASVIIADQSGNVYSYDRDLSSASSKLVAQNCPAKFIKLSPDCTNIAFSNGAELISIYPVDFRAEVFRSNSGRSHEGIWWVGNSAIVLVAENDDGEADIFSVQNNSASQESGSNVRPTTTYFDDSHVALIMECDGLRIFGSKNQSLLQAVSRATSETFKLGSVAPSSILYSCVDQIDAGSPRSDQTIKLLEQRQLTRALDTCIAAALSEIDPKIQKRLMRAASFGKTMLTVYDSSRYLEALDTLRILNALRALPQNPLFITESQLQWLGVQTLLQRLEARCFWAEAVSIAKILHIPIEPVYIEWACWLIQNSEQKSDEELAQELDSKLGKLEAYSHSKMALRALEQGRQKLALNLLETEPVASERVHLLLEMNMAQPALEQAIRSGNVALIDYALIILSEQLSFPQLMRIIGGNKVAIDRQVLLLDSKSDSKDQLHDFLYHLDHRSKSLLIEYEDTSQETEPTKKIHMLNALENKFNGSGKKSFSDSRACSDWADLLTMQKQLEESYDVEVCGKSAAETITVLLKLPQISQAQKVKTKLGISDRQFWWLRIRALIDRREFDNLWDLSQSRKSPIGYQPFFDSCVEAGSLENAARYVEMISEASVEDKVKMFLKTKHVAKAKELAAKSRNAQLIALAGE